MSNRENEQDKPLKYWKFRSLQKLPLAGGKQWVSTHIPLRSFPSELSRVIVDLHFGNRSGRYEFQLAPIGRHDRRRAICPGAGEDAENRRARL